MSLFSLDTDTLSLLQHHHPVVLQNVNSHPSSDVTITAITIEEQMQGFENSLRRARTDRQTAFAYDMLVNRLLPSWCRIHVLPFTETAILRFKQLRALRLNIGPMDLRIAAIALENNLTVVTRNQRDFGRVPALVVVDWSV